LKRCSEGGLAPFRCSAFNLDNISFADEDAAHDISYLQHHLPSFLPAPLFFLPQPLLATLSKTKISPAVKWAKEVVSTRPTTSQLKNQPGNHPGNQPTHPPGHFHAIGRLQ